MKKKRTSVIINLLIIFIVLSIVLYFSLKENYQEIINAIRNMNYGFVVLSILILCLYRALASLGHYLVIRINQEKVSFIRCLQINFIILFFHGVTPFAGGGQPMEIYYLHNEHIPVTKATNITLQNFIVYQIALVLVGIFALTYNIHFQLFPSNHLIKRLVILGFAINFLVLVVTFLLSFGNKLHNFVCEKVIHFLAKIKIVKDEKKIQKQLAEYLINFHENALELKKHKSVVVYAVFTNILGLLMLYSMPYMVSKGLHIDISLMDAIVTTAYVMIIGSFVPIPGGTGGIEYGFVFFFGYLIKGSVLNAVMLVWRFISYYLGIIFGAIALSLYRKKEVKTCE